jgi:Transposase, Mutator family
VYAVPFSDAVNVRIREGQVANRPIYLALGITVDGERDILGLWVGEHGDGEEAKYWLRVLSEIKNRGVKDVCVLVCDGLKGLPDAGQRRLGEDDRANLHRPLRRPGAYADLPIHVERRCVLILVAIPALSAIRSAVTDCAGELAG